MKKVILLCLFSFLIQAKVLRPIELDWGIYNDYEIVEFLSLFEHEKDEEIIMEIQVAKLALLTGEVNAAIEILTNITEAYPHSPITLIAGRYLAISYFSIGKYKESYEILQAPQYQTINNYRNICVLKIASMLNFEKTNIVQFEMNECKRLNEEYSPNNFIWFDYLNEYLTKNDYKKINKEILNKLSRYESPDYVRNWLKFGILFGEQKLITDNIDLLPEQAFRNEVLRTLLAYNLYRSKKFNMAKDFIEDINNANANYLKALLSGRQGDLKTTYAHLLAALKKRAYSINANQFMVATAWRTNHFEEGRLALSKIIPLKKHVREKKLLNVAFLIQEENFNRALYDIERIYEEYNKKMPLQGVLLESYVYLHAQDQRWKEKSDQACSSFDGVNCWLHLQSLLWNNFDKDYLEFKNTKFKVTKFIEDITTSEQIAPINENIFIKQKDINELDVQIDPYLEDMGENESDT